MTKILQNQNTDWDLPQVRKTAFLSRIALSGEEETAFQRDLEDIFAFAGSMDAGEPLPDVPGASRPPVMRDDTVIPSADRRVMLMNAAVKTEECIAVPSFMEAE